MMMMNRREEKGHAPESFLRDPQGNKHEVYLASASGPLQQPNAMVPDLSSITSSMRSRQQQLHVPFQMPVSLERLSSSFADPHSTGGPHQNLAFMFQQQQKRSSLSPKHYESLDMNLSFPIKLHYILSHPDFPDAVWLPHGRAFKILNAKRFEEQVIPEFFRSSKLASFMRQLNGWAFTRITNGPDANAYYHCMFLRGLPALCTRMKRPPKTKSAAAEARNNAGASEGIPNFERISQFAPLPPAIAWLPDSKESATILSSAQKQDILMDESNFQVVASANDMQMMQWDTGADDEKDGSSATTTSSTAHHRLPGSSPPPLLSAADLAYLKHQNRNLQKYSNIQVDNDESGDDEKESNAGDDASEGDEESNSKATEDKEEKDAASSSNERDQEQNNKMEE